MPRTRTLSELREEATQVADMEYSDLVSTAEKNRYINRSIARLYGKLVQTRGEQYYRTSAAFTVSGGSGVVALPTDFFKLVGIDLDRNAGSDRPILARELVWSLRNKVEALPDGRTGTIWYVPYAAVLDNDTDTFDGINGWEDWVVLDTAVRMLMKEESDTTDLVRERALLEEDINGLKSTRDFTEAGRIQDVRRDFNTAFYSLEGSNVRMYQLSPETLDFLV